VVFAQVLFAPPRANASVPPGSVMEVIHIIGVDEGSITSVQMINLLNYVRIVSFNQMLIQARRARIKSETQRRLVVWASGV